MTITDSDERTVADLLDEAVAALTGAGVESPRLDARLLLAHATGTDQARLIARPQAPVGREQCEAFAGLVRRRARREPVSRILGWREFYGRQFTLAPSVLDPRPDSETVIGCALALLSGRASEPLRICDLGTGSGALLVTILAELPLATGLGIDIDVAALAVARANARRHGVAGRAWFCAADWDRPLATTFDLVLANPPYVERAAIAGLAPEVRDHDPVRALDGGADGLDGHRAVAAAAARLIAPATGYAVIEVGAGQARAVRRIVRGCGLLPAVRGAPVRDLAGFARVVAVRKA